MENDMTAKDDGGPAFPQGKSETVGAISVTDIQGGMTLRDWFAGEAPEAPVWWMIEGCPQPPPGWSDGYGATKWSELTIDWRVNRIALWRWKYADAMIAARKGGEQ